MAQDSIDVTIIVPCRNEARHVRQFVDALVNQQFGNLRWEAIIADGMSDDGTREYLIQACREHPEVSVIDNPRRIVSTGLNAAIRQARGRYIVRMDFHTEYSPDYVTRCIALLEETGAQNVGGPARTKARGWLARAIAGAYHSRFACGGARFHDEDYEGEIDTVPYGCWHKSTLEKIGLFDEMLVRNQDDELNLRLIRAGGKVWQSSSIVSWYMPRSSLRSLWRQYFQYGFWKIPVIRKHRIPASWRHLVPGTFVAANVVLLAAALFEILKFPGSFRFLGLWLAMMAAYGCCSVAAAWAVARKAGWELLPLLPIVFGTYHLSYGSGFLIGLVYWRGRRGEAVEQAGDLFTQISR